MRKQALQATRTRRSVNSGPLVVLGQHKKIEGKCVFYARNMPAITTYSTHETGPPGGSGPPCETGPLAGFGPPGGAGRPCGTGPPSGAGPPEGTGPPQIAGLLNGNSMPLKPKRAVIVKQTTKPKEKLKNQSLKRKEKMKNYKPIVRIGQIIASGLLMLQATGVFAAAGDLIGNRATLTFNGGTVLESDPLGNSATGATNGGDTEFVEDRIINFVVTETTGLTVSAGTSTSGNVLEFTVTNTGNGTQDFLLAAVNNVGGTDPITLVADTFESTANVFVEDGTTPGSYQASEDLGIYIAGLAPTLSRTVYIVSDMPAAPATGEVSVVSLVAQAATVVAGGSEATAADAGAGINDDDNGSPSPIASDYCNGDAACNVAAGSGTGTGLGGVTDIPDDPANEEIVFNDPAASDPVDEDSAGATDVDRNGQASDTGSYTIVGAVISVTKTVGAAVFDTINLTNNVKALPGATSYIPYTITISNAGPGSAILTNITDQLGATLRIDPDFTSDNGTTFEAPPFNVSAQTFEIDTGINLPAVSTRTAALSYCTAAADADTCSAPIALGSLITVSLNDAASGLIMEDVAPAGAGPEDYVAGELKDGDTITIRFQVIMQ